jgi:hypothetical protein
MSSPTSELLTCGQVTGSMMTPPWTPYGVGSKDDNENNDYESTPQS